MNKIGDSLKKKIGPLPAWAWILLFGVGVWYYRNKLSAGSVSGTGTGSVAPVSPTPQPVTVLGPGEAAYDPNTGTLTSNPDTGGGGGILNAGAGGVGTGDGGGLGGQDNTALPPPANDNTPLPVGGGPTASPPIVVPFSTVSPLSKPRLTAKGAVYAPFGAKKPAARKGYTIRGLGRGFWEYVPVRHPKAKAQHGPPKKTTAPPKGILRTRSDATHRNGAGGRTSGRSGGVSVSPSGRTRGGVKPSASQPRQQSTKRTNPLVSKPVMIQRPVASHAPNRPAAVPSTHRTASTPPRSVSRTRSAAPPPPPPPPPRRPPPPPPPPPRRPPPPPPRKTKR